MKQCRKCKKWKNKKEFYKDKRRKDGLQSYCKPCHITITNGSRSEQAIAKQKEYRQSPEYKAYMREYRQSERGKAAAKRDRQRHAAHYKARDIVNNAIKKGALPQVHMLECQSCSQQAKEYHHHNGYEKKFQLDVIPLCCQCHIS